MRRSVVGEEMAAAEAQEQAAQCGSARDVAVRVADEAIGPLSALEFDSNEAGQAVAAAMTASRRFEWHVGAFDDYMRELLNARKAEVSDASDVEPTEAVSSSRRRKWVPSGQGLCRGGRIWG